MGRAKTKHALFSFFFFLVPIESVFWLWYLMQKQLGSVSGTELVFNF